MKRVLVTGVAGEVGSSLVRQLALHGGLSITGLDVREPHQEISSLCSHVQVGDISDSRLVSSLGNGNPYDTVFHLAGILSSGGERDPLRAHQVNVSGTLNILELSRAHSQLKQEPVTVIFTSTIAVHGISTLSEKQKAGRITESEYLSPITMYGANKLYCESLGRYYSEHFGMLEGSERKVRPDFRALRFPGLLSAHTLPTGGTSDFAPEMVHAMAQGVRYQCFVRPDSRIPFMMMPDAVRALVMLSDAKPSQLSQRVYNVGAFAPSASDIRELLARHFPNAPVDYKVHRERQTIVDTWPEDIDDSAASRDFGWLPQYSLEKGCLEYLLPAVKLRYAGGGTHAVDSRLVAN